MLCDDELVQGAYEQSGLQFGVPDYGNQDGDTQLRLTEDPRSLLPCVFRVRTSCSGTEQSVMELKSLVDNPEAWPTYSVDTMAEMFFDHASVQHHGALGL